MKTFAFSLLFLGVASSVVFGQADISTRTRVSTTPLPKSPTIQNDATRPATDRPARVFSAQNGGQPAATPTPGAGSRPIIGESDEEIKVETNLVTMPVSVLDRDGRFVSGLAQRDFEIFENGAKQEIEYFQSVEHPFTVVVLIDVSPSTQFLIEEIQDAATAFVNQLRPADKVMIISFDEKFRVLSQPTNNRSQLRNAISMTEFGKGTSLYEAVDNALKHQLAQIEGRKAVVMFTDGVDTTSRRANYRSTVAHAEETDALIYPIRFNTQRHVYAGGGGGRMGKPAPRRGQGGSSDAILAGQPTSSVPMGGSAQEYETGRLYLEEIAAKSGGRSFNADSLTTMETAFKGIAEELRQQYYVGYYPDAVGQKGERRQIKVAVGRPGMVVRAKASYIVGTTNTQTGGKLTNK